MKRILLFVYCISFSGFCFSQPVVDFKIETLPVNHPAGSDIFIAGSFNNWNPQDAKYRFQKDEQGNYLLQLKLNPGSYEYKITRGGWDKVETSKSGGVLQNRQLKIGGNETVLLDIEEWQDRFPAKPRVSSASRHVKVIDTAFLIPQLNRTRRVWVYLPVDYAHSKSKYPVLYMQDGQNVFDDATSFSGEWGIDEYLDTVSLRKSIVVAVDHGGGVRINEYSPYDMDRFGKGEGDAYVDFLVKTLRPFINKRFRTIKRREHTWVAGSSMGGLISMYAILKYPKIFGGAGVFSPAFWVGPKIFDDIKTKGRDVKGSVYFYGGKLEGETMVPHMMKAFGEMAKVSKARMEIVIRDEGRHNEPTWRKEFPLFYKWLVGSK